MSNSEAYPYPDERTQGQGAGRTAGAPYGAEPPVTGQGYLSDDERAASIVAHLSAPAAAILSAGWVSFLGPLIVWFIYRNRSAAVRRAAAGAFNFNVAFSILYIVGWVLVFTLVGIPVALVLWAVIFLVAAWCHVKGALRSARGESYDYPFQIRILN